MRKKRIMRKKVRARMLISLISQGDKKMSYLQAALKVISQRQISSPEARIRLVEKKTAPLPKGRQQSLEMLMEAVVAHALGEIAIVCNGRQFRANDEVRQAEDNIMLIYKNVMIGESKLQDYHEAVKLWKDLSLIENAIKTN